MYMVRSMYHRRMMILFFIVFIIAISYYIELKEGFDYYDQKNNVSSSQYTALYKDYNDLLTNVNNNIGSYSNYINNINS